jgi:hypothetical protein
MIPFKVPSNSLRSEVILAPQFKDLRHIFLRDLPRVTFGDWFFAKKSWFAFLFIGGLPSIKRGIGYAEIPEFGRDILCREYVIQYSEPALCFQCITDLFCHRSDLLDCLLNYLQECPRRSDMATFAYFGLGETDRVFDWLEKAVAERDGFTNNVHVFSFFAPLRSHPRYHALLRKMNLEA